MTLKIKSSMRTVAEVLKVSELSVLACVVWPERIKHKFIALIN